EVSRTVAASDDALTEGLVDALLRFAEAAEEVSSYRPYLGRESWDGFVRLVRLAQAQAEELALRTLQEVRYDEAQRDWAERRLRELARELEQLTSRAATLLNTGRVEEL